ncbi:Sodium/potassium-transporting ATPase subunit alpha [Folsomia candida]|uniref:Sodium/potassium-transporting ATPase subunit alpha n=3 Tax=Folsomia candida TaxID=158441 RepID=A0A226EH91_FOLCA|nr:Sodium/potassium-transporting ATPase subunit alpha [Folsomia candida]
MKTQRFNKGSYNFKEKDDGGDEKSKKLGKLRFAFNKTIEPELKQFVLEGWNGEKKRSVNYRAGWDIDEHRISLGVLASRYGTDLENGLSDDAVKMSRATFGENILHTAKKRSEWLKFLENTLMGLNLLLWVCGMISIGAGVVQYMTNDMDDATGSLYSGVSLLVVVLIAGSFSYYQEFQSNRVMESFKKMAPQTVTVIRSGQRIQLDSTEIVVGDIIELNYGDKLPADVRIIECQSFKVDNSSITGESDPQSRTAICTDKDADGRKVEWSDAKNLAFFSTSVIQGFAKGIVIKIGHSTLIGRLAKLASSVESTESPIAKEMNRIIRLMTTLSLFFGVIFYGIGIWMKYSWLNALFFVIGIVVGNVPENLSVTLTIILALAAKKMAKKNCLVKQLHAVETLGSASVICSDKTGTLTQNKMSVAHLWFNNKIAEADTTEYAKGKGNYNVSDPGFLELANVGMLCSKAKFKPGQNVPILSMEAEGDSSEVAILKCMELQFGSVEEYRKNFPKIFEIPFNSISKYQISVHKSCGKEQGFMLVMKGAPERIVDLCSSVLIGEVEHVMDFKMKEQIKDTYLKFASLGERVLGFCDCQLPSQQFPDNFVFDENNFEIGGNALRFVGLMSLIDPPRSAVPNAVLRCKAAGVKIAMITGDHPVTATAIARAVNIISPGNKTAQEMANKIDTPPEIAKAAVFTGSELTAMSPEELQYCISIYDELVFARTSPEQKYEIVKAYQKLGHIVAVSGDGVNDASSLKKANIGIAVGSGTEVAKEVADLILLDDNFASIVSGIEDGRLIFDNLKKLIRYTMADNVAEMYCYWVYIILRVPLPMGTIGMLLSTLGADVFPAVALAHESAESDIMKLKPRDPNKDTLMTLPMLSYSYGQIGVLETLGGFFAYFCTFACNGWLPKDLLFSQSRFESSAVNDLSDSYGQEWSYDTRMTLEKQAQTAFFLSIVITQFANAICCKTRRLSIFQQGMKNNLMNVGLVLMISIPCIFIYTPYVNTAVSFVPLK